MRKLVQQKGSLCPSGHWKAQDGLTASQFSKEGQFLAVGDDRGRLAAFRYGQEGLLSLVSETQAESRTLDWENKLEPEPAIRGVEWLHSHGSKTGLLTVSSKSVKLWKLTENTRRAIQRTEGPIPVVSDTALPIYSLGLRSYYYQIRKELPRLHTSRIQGAHVSASEDYLLTYDSNRILKWNLENSATPYVLFEGLDREGPSAPTPQSEDHGMATEAEQYEEEEWASVGLLTCAKFHGGSDNRAAFSTKNGDILYVDMRISNRAKPSVVLYSDPPNDFLRRYLNAISEFTFLNDEFTVVSRDYLYVKVWDMRFPTDSIKKYSVFPSINNKLCALYEDDRLTDRFRISANSSGTKVATNHFDSSFHEIDLLTDVNVRYRVNPDGTASSDPVRGMNLLGEFKLDPKPSSLCYSPLTDDLSCTVQSSLSLFRSQNSTDSY